MIDAHYHRDGRTFLSVCGREYAFAGTHPWRADEFRADELRSLLASDPAVGVGEIGLDRLRTKTVSDVQRSVFQAQLEIAAEFSRPVVLHGAKCWGEVVKACKMFAGKIPAFLFHGFSRSDGLIPDIVAINGFVSAGKSVLNDHAVNYRDLLCKIPADRLLAESDCDVNEDVNPIAEVISKISDLTRITEMTMIDNAERFIGALAVAVKAKAEDR